jgi:SAM-dependent methyltransferase
MGYPPAATVQADWNAAAGQTWAQFQEQLDRQMAPLGLEAIRELAPTAGEHILDIGCGCGQTSMELAGLVGLSGRVVGIDISTPMLEVALRRTALLSAPRPELRQVDAQMGDLGRPVYDAAFSRFGVMFFDDPVAAFANIAASLKPSGRLIFVCWRALEGNPWIHAPLKAVQQLLPSSAPLDPTAPGPFAFADSGRLRSILIEAGFSTVKIRPFDTSIGGAGIDDTVRLTCRLGPVAAALRERPDMYEAAANAVTRVIAPYCTPTGVLMPAAVWIVSGSLERRT